MIKRAIISVSDKAGIVEFARALVDLGVEILSTGGTASALRDAGLPVTNVSDVTGFPECLDGRVKTLHPMIHGGILCIRDNPEHMARIAELGIRPIDLIVINLYPFKKTMLTPGVDWETCIENIDIGGPSMLRAAAKNHGDVTVAIDPSDYSVILEQIRTHGDTLPETRVMLAGKVFEHTAAYDALIASYFRSQSHGAEMPSALTMTYDLQASMRYGENPHQKAWLYRDSIPDTSSLPMASQVNGKELSYNNYADTDAAIALLKEFEEPTVVAVKHANPCGVACGKDIFTAWEKAFEADPVSIYGGIVAANRTIDAVTAAAMKPVFLEVLVAPGFTPEALEILTAKKNLRILVLPDVGKPIASGSLTSKKILGGMLIQEQDTQVFDPGEIKTVTAAQADPACAADLAFAMKVVKHVKSNAIVLVKDLQTVGIGPGQVNRIGSLRIAAGYAGDKARGSVMGSDAYFPFRDCVDAAFEAGVQAIIQPGGSIRDEESIAACNEHGIAMQFTGMRHFRH